MLKKFARGVLMVVGALLFWGVVIAFAGCSAPQKEETVEVQGQLQGNFYNGLFSAYYVDLWGQNQLAHKAEFRFVVPPDTAGAVGQAGMLHVGLGGLNDPWYDAMPETGFTVSRINSPIFPGQTVTKWATWVRCSPDPRQALSLTQQMPIAVGDVIDASTELVSYSPPAGAVFHHYVRNWTQNWIAERNLTCPASSNYLGLSAQVVFEREWNGVIPNFHSIDLSFMRGKTLDGNGIYHYPALGDRFDMYESSSGRLLVRTDWFGADNQTGRFIWVNGQ